MKSYTALPCEYGEIYSLNLQKDKKKAMLVNGIADGAKPAVRSLARSLKA